MFEAMCKAFDIETPEKEYRFHPKRRWRFDYAFPNHKIAVEIEGGVWIDGRHNRASGFIKDMEKYNAAAVLGWRIYRILPDGIKKQKTYKDLRQLIPEAK